MPDNDQDPPIEGERRTAPVPSRQGRRKVDDADLPREGTVVDGKYRVERLLGAGGMGVVVAAMHLGLNERVALKFVKVGNASTELVERLRREARIAFRIKSEHVARLLDVGTLDSGAPYLVMEHLTGQDLADVLAERGPLPIAEAVDYVLQACEAMAEAHRLGIVHRDLKPSNLFLTQRAEGTPLVKVLDFGIAKAAAGSEGPADPITVSSSVMGSPLYMSPEQVRGAKDVDLRTDLWSLGVILHELLAGKPPFPPGPASAVCAAIAADEPEPLRKRRPDAPAELEEIVLRCLEKDPARRFPSVGALGVALTPFAPDASSSTLQRIASLTSEVDRASLPTSTLLPASIRDGADPGITQSAWNAQGTPPRATFRYALVPLMVIAAVAAWAATRHPSPAAPIEISPTTAASLEAPAPSQPAASLASATAVVASAAPRPSATASADVVATQAAAPTPRARPVELASSARSPALAPVSSASIAPAPTASPIDIEERATTRRH